MHGTARVTILNAPARYPARSPPRAALAHDARPADTRPHTQPRSRAFTPAWNRVPASSLCINAATRRVAVRTLTPN